MNPSSADDTVAVLNQFEDFFSRRPDSIRRTQDTIGILYQQWLAEGYVLVANELQQGQDTLVMSKMQLGGSVDCVGTIRAAIDLGHERAWGVLPT